VTKNRSNPKVPESSTHCDLYCPYAEFPKEDALAGDCHREIALNCKKYKRLVYKNNKCLDKKLSLS